MAGLDTLREVIADLNRHDAEAFAEHYTPDAVVEDPQYPEPLRGRDAVRRDMEDFFRAFPDLHADVRSSMEDGDAVAFEARMSGTHSGPLPGPAGELPPTGKPMALNVAIHVRYDAAGKIVEEHRYYDVANLVGQLGVTGAGPGAVNAPPAASPT